MTLGRLLAANLVFHRFKHASVLAGTALAAAIVVGALTVGDSVRQSLHDRALRRLGEIQFALAPSDRYFTDQLGRDVSVSLKATASSVLSLSGVAACGDRQANRVTVLGVDNHFWDFARDAGAEIDDSLSYRSKDGPLPVVFNSKLARTLGAKLGDEVMLRISEASLQPLDQPVAGPEKYPIGLRGRVVAIAGDDHLGNFDLRASALAPANAFVPRQRLQQAAGIPGQSNLLLSGGGDLAAAQSALRARWRLADAGLTFRTIAATGQVELASQRIFIEQPVASAALAMPTAQGVLTYLVNSISANGRSTPYSMVTAVGAANGGGQATTLPAILPAGLADDQIAVNRWLADDLALSPGDRLTLGYYVMGPDRRLQTRRREFTVHSVVPLDGPYADRQLMPEFPGLARMERTSDWRPGFDVDFSSIRPKDDDYWRDHRGAPKAFVTLAAGREMWANRFGNLTAVRWPAGSDQVQLEAALREKLDPALLGLSFQPVRAQAMQAAQQSQDFGGLFLGFSMFLIASAMLLAGLLFALGVEQRSGEVGTLLAVGFSPGRVRMLLLAEGSVVALAGCALGCLGGVGYARLALRALGTIWSDALAGTVVQLAVKPATVLLGGAVTLAAALAVMYFTLRRQVRSSASSLMAAGADRAVAAPSRRRRAILAVLAIILAGGAAGAAIVSAISSRPNPEAFFAAGSCLLLSGLAGCALLLQAMAARGGGKVSLAGLAMRNLVRRRGRSLAVIVLLACGTFIVVAVGANRQAPVSPQLRDSGTGGFAFYGELAMPVTFDLNTAKGLQQAGVDPEGVSGLAVVPMRLAEGDDASCLNLNRAGRPRILGVDPALLKERGSFHFAAESRVAGVSPASGAGRMPATPKTAQGAAGWAVLDEPLPDGAIPAVADQTTIAWALGSGLGKTLTYTDETGRPLKLRIVGLLDGSILQGGLIVSQANFVDRFPSAGGYRVLLVDSPPDRADANAAALSRGLRDRGLDLQVARDRMAEFQAVENAYLAIFQALGGLGLLLGSLALAVVILRNLMQRRGELALMRAVGYQPRRLRLLVLLEYWVLLGLGLLCGVAAGLLAVTPAMQTRSLPAGSLALTVLAVLAGGVLWTLLAVLAALRGNLLDALRNE
jgi:ABC-type lipoprotein release transport system permease subunit